MREAETPSLIAEHPRKAQRGKAVHRRRSTFRYPTIFRVLGNFG